MKHPVVATCLAGVALAFSSFTTASADSGSPSPSVEILVGARIRPVYIHEGRWYVEALKGREYAIRIRNPYDVRVAVARERLEAHAPSAPAAPSTGSRDGAAAAPERQESDSQLAATGMGDPTDHAVTQVWMDLEDEAAHAVSVRYEFRAQLVQLGVLPATPVNDALARRERARGFEPGFAPVPHHLR